MVPPGDPVALKNSILKLFQDVALRKRFAEAGRKRVLRQFSYTKMNARYFDMFEHQYSTISPEEVHDDRVKRVLVDLDNTVVNWDREFIKRFSMRNVMSPDEVQKRLLRTERLMKLRKILNKVFKQPFLTLLLNQDSMHLWNHMKELLQR